MVTVHNAERIIVAYIAAQLGLARFKHRKINVAATLCRNIAAEPFAPDNIRSRQAPKGRRQGRFGLNCRSAFGARTDK